MEIVIPDTRPRMIKSSPPSQTGFLNPSLLIRQERTSSDGEEFTTPNQDTYVPTEERLTRRLLEQQDLPRTTTTTTKGNPEKPSKATTILLSDPKTNAAPKRRRRNQLDLGVLRRLALG